MSVSFYRNILNQEMKKFGKFTKKISENLMSDNIKTDIIFDARKGYCLKAMQKYDTIVIVSHGSANEIYHKFDRRFYNHQVLFNQENLHLMENKKIIAISCGTARNLGDNACIKGGCKAFLGFYNKIHFDKKSKERASKQYHVFIVDCYKEALTKVLESSIKNNWTFGKLKEVLKIELRQTVMRRALHIQSTRPRYYIKHGLNQAILAVMDVANNIHVFGDENEKVS